MSLLFTEPLFVVDVIRKGTNNTVILQNITTTPVSIKTLIKTNSSMSPVGTDVKYVIKENTTPLTIVLNDSYHKYLEDITTNYPTGNVITKDLNEREINNVIENTTTTKTTNFIINVSDINDGKEEKQDGMIYLIDRISNGNDLKFKKWSKMKLLKDNAKKFKLIKSKNLDNIFGDKKAKIAELTSDVNKRTYVKQQVRKVGVSKKFNVNKLLNTSKTIKDEKITINNTNIYYANNKITQLQTFVKNLLNRFGRNNTKKSGGKSKQSKVLRYMRNFFRKIFHSRQIKISNNKRRFLENNYLIKTLCENFGPCEIGNIKKQKLLEIKLKDISYETTKILKILNIIKGLLHLVELPVNNKVNLNEGKSSFNDDMLKLNAILKDTYQKSISETNAIQIEYIKNNTKEFVQAIGKFATLLNEIIVILTKTKKNNIDSEKLVTLPLKSNINKDDAFAKIKTLLLKYDIIHNTFLKKMYDTIHSFELKLNPEKPAKVNTKESRNITSINHFSSNIIANLRKLTHLAQELNSKRPKREVMRDDNVIEYLLMLMEYLLKQHYPLNSAPGTAPGTLLIF